jgi:riboflavin biosynthesis pyrimidine reductase
MRRDALEREIEALYGARLGAARGVVHVASAWAAPGGALVSLRINAATPPSRSDRFILELARARAEAIVTTGRVLRTEPGLTHVLPPDLASWRRDVLGRSDAPISIILTGRPDLDLDHPLLRTSSRPLVHTTPEVSAQLTPRACDAGVEVEGCVSASIETAIASLRQGRGCDSVLLEAGPSTLRPLYREGGPIDELLLSIYTSRDVPEAALGEPWFRPATLAAMGLSCASSVEREEESGRWRFERHVGKEPQRQRDP